jgi:hypothetical protein
VKKLTSLAFAAVLATTGTVAFAEQDTQQKDQVGPVAMTDAQLDNVAAGLIAIPVTVVVVDLADVSNVANNNDVAVGIPINAAVALLGAARAEQLPIIGNAGRR